MKTGSEEVIRYTIDGEEYIVYGCWDGETPENKYEFYDVEVNGECINLGNPFWTKPTFEDIKKFLKGG
jgi:hypothetical protein